MKRLEYPFSEAAVRGLCAGEAVSLNGRIWTGRDRLHKHFADGGALPADMRDGALFHCGPVVTKRANGEWGIVAAGPTTSVRENPYEPALIAAAGLRMIIGKGGMDARTLEACAKCGAAYLQAVGGAAAILARAVKRVRNVYFLEEFGAAEACWELEVENFECVVAMDSRGNSLFAQVEAESRARLEALLDSPRCTRRANRKMQ